MSISDRIKEYEKTALAAVLNGTDPDGDVDRMYVPREYTQQLYHVIVKDMMRHLAAHALANSSAADVFAQWCEIYEGKRIDPAPKLLTQRIDDFDF